MVIDLPQIFEDQTVTIVGGGPSLKDFNFLRLRSPVIGTNHTPKYHPADMLIAIDVKFHQREEHFLNMFRGYKATYVKTPRSDFIVAELDPDHQNKNLDWHILAANLSGYFALALALHLGAQKVYLLGFDGGYDKEPNWHPHGYFGPGMNTYTGQNHFYDFFKGENVINVGMSSRLDAFRKIPLDSDFYDVA